MQYSAKQNILYVWIHTQWSTEFGDALTQFLHWRTEAVITNAKKVNTKVEDDFHGELIPPVMPRIGAGIRHRMTTLSLFAGG
jgi:hypothetical protein